MRVSYLAAARSDLESIWLFGANLWSIALADRYASELDAMIRRLTANPGKGVATPQTSPGLRRLIFRSHAIFYRVEDDGVVIVRVLHQSADAGRWVG